MSPELQDILEQNGYTDVRYVEGWGICGIQRMIFTVGACYGMDESGMKGRFCFDTQQNAELFLRDWDGTTLPEVGTDGCTALK
jgi:hypothetical protein